MSTRPPVADPFRAVHRARNRRTAGAVVTGSLFVAAIVAATWVMPAAVAEPVPVPASTALTQPAPAPDSEGVPPAPAPPAVPPAPAVLAAPPVPAGSPVSAASVVEAAPTGPAGSVPAAPLPAPAPSTPAVRAIAIDTSGYQAELDECLWVRMDLVAASAPIVGAHNNCGGDVVLELQPGDLVELSGENLDGRYLVIGSRDGRPGQDAGEATAGFGATVILQTCYFEGPNVRLVSLIQLG
jgi:hypothetical protein